MIILASLLAWLPVLFVPFINDDYQIIGFHSAGKGLSALLRPFYSPDISGVYWRPLGNMLHPVLLLIAGFNPFVFRLVSLFLYTLCCLSVARGGEHLGLSKNASILSAVIFAVLPSHVFQLAWIAEQGELLLAIFLILSFIYYRKAVLLDYSNKKYIFFALLFFIASLLLKELAFAGILIPLINIAASADINRKKIINAIRDMAIAFIAVVCILAYRSIVIGGSPFDSKHFSGGGAAQYVLNFLIYIPLTFCPPEMLEQLFSIISNRILLIGLIIFAIILLVIIIYGFKKISAPEKRAIIAGIIWFLVFIIPGLPTLMRWYVFTASIGIIWSLAVFLQVLYSIWKRRVILYVFTLLVFSLGVYDLSMMLKWQAAGWKMNVAIKSLQENGNQLTGDSLLVFAVPDKIDRIPMMKLGIQETVQWALRNKNMNVYSPIRAELTGGDSRIELVEKSDSTIKLHLTGGRFLPAGGKSKSILSDEKIDFSNEGIICRIRTFVSSNNKSHSYADIILTDWPVRSNIWFYDGNLFQTIIGND